MTILLYDLIFVLMVIGLLIILVQRNKFKRLFGLSIFQNSVLAFYIAVGFVTGGEMPIFSPEVKLYVNPLPHVLMLTAIVVGVATVAVGLALIIKEKKK